MDTGVVNYYSYFSREETGPKHVGVRPGLWGGAVVHLRGPPHRLCR